MTCVVQKYLWILAGRSRIELEQKIHCRTTCTIDRKTKNLTEEKEFKRQKKELKKLC